MARNKSRAKRAGIEVTGGDILSDMMLRLQPLTRKNVRIGMTGDSELAMIAGVHEYGSAKMNIPARSFVRTGQKKGQVPIGKLVRASVGDIARGRKKAKHLFRQIGEIGLDRMVKNFDRIRTPPLSAKYAKVKRGPNKILQREKDLRDSMTYVIEARRR